MKTTYMNEQALDFIGRPIKAGDVVAYPVRRGADMWLRSLRVAHVDVIRSVPPVFKIVGTNDKGRTVKLEKPDRCVILPGVDNTRSS
jgi:hypothetical protein